MRNGKFVFGKYRADVEWIVVALVLLRGLDTNRVATLDGRKLVQYDGAIMMAKTQITLGTEMQRRARQRANDLGVSLAEYFRRLVARDLARPETAAHVDRIFDLGSSGGSDIASQKDSMIAEAFHSTRRKLRRR
jgi:hypothetical protein